MNDDDPSELIAALKVQHRRLDEEIERLREAGNVDQMELARLKKQKLHLKDEIERLLDNSTPDIIA
ncbi:YdcH family protein [Sphingomicrobium clamense]|uniref:YdcH family protein n=1 Tax=Sphingomicrobium clamense TaxID=2851013 RepID=A0ABS6V6W3_9SPHN|nr:YdcH family protein [Sphingomicrobium sp. B8]MBW0145300.1 YdcH family protein [Sphingomicrobium sp. B8]